MKLNLVHIGINTENRENASELALLFQETFGFGYEERGTSFFTADDRIEIMEYLGRGSKGHIAFECENLDVAVEELSQKGIEFDEESKMRIGDELVNVYLKDEFGGFAVHIIKKFPSKEAFLEAVRKVQNKKA